MQYTITLADGRKLTELGKNGDNFVSTEKVDETIFVDNLATMTIFDGDTETTYHDMAFVQQMQWIDGTYYLAFRQISPEEKIADQNMIMLRSMAATTTTLPDTVALKIPDLLPTWDELIESCEPIQPGTCLMYNGKCYRMVQSNDVIPQEHQPPGSDGMLAVYRPIDKQHAGTQDDPIPWVYGMDCKTGKYYSYNGMTYLCNADMMPCVWAPDTAGLWQWTTV